MLRERGRLVKAMDLRLADLDVLAMPTTAVVAPLISEAATPDNFGRHNAMLLRNTVDRQFFRSHRHFAAVAA